MRLLLGGSPCTWWSSAQTMKRERKPEGLGWELFQNYVLAKEKFKPDYFLYENNVSASKEIKQEISKELGAELQEINSNLVSAQNQNRFYVHNIPKVGQPKDRKVKLSDILDTGVSFRGEKLYCLDAHYYKGGNLINFNRQSSQCLAVAEELILMGEPVELGSLQGDIATDLNKKYSKDKKYIQVGVKDSKGRVGFIGLLDYDSYMDSSKRLLGHRIPVVTRQSHRALYAYEVKDGKVQAGDGWHAVSVKDGIYFVRILSVAEACRAQTMPDDYCDGVTKTAAYRCLGNGWTAEVIIHILNYLPIAKDEPIEVLSLYDGIGTGRYCLDRLGFRNVKYYAYEIEPNAIQIATRNYPDIIECGNANALKETIWKLHD